MKRQIKFRVWFNHQMIYTDGGMMEVYFDNIPWNEKKSGILMQFTGLKDKNGKEIYEGDIIKDIGINIIEEVKWISRKDGWDYSGWYSNHISLPFKDDNNLVEIIGNIFENPELLK